MIQEIYCKYCSSNKLYSDFNKCNYTKNGLQQRCRACEKKYRTENKKSILIRAKEYSISNKEQIKETKKKYYRNNKEKILEKTKKWTLLNKERCKKVRHEKYTRTKERALELSKQWRIKNLDRSRAYQNAWCKHKRSTDPHYKLEHRLRNRLLIALKRGKGAKTQSFKELTGCTIDELKIHIESKFRDGMNWDKVNNGEIQIDHIKPCCSFDLTKIEDQKICFHYTNLQPLWKKENRYKLQEDLKQKLITL